MYYLCSYDIGLGDKGDTGPRGDPGDRGPRGVIGKRCMSSHINGQQLSIINSHSLRNIE